MEPLRRDFEWIGFNKLFRVLKLSGRAINEEPLRVGAGPGKAVFEPVDLVVLKVAGAPAIPGSSWKGLFRSLATLIARTAGLEVCDGLPEATCLKGNELEHELIAKGEVKMCLGCLMFGAPSFYSHVAFSDSYPSPAGNYRLGYRTCVAIDRRKGVSHRGALFTVEYVEPGCSFSFELRAENLPNYALGLLSEALFFIDAGMAKVGGLKSRGFGKVRFEDLAIELYSPSHELHGVRRGELAPLDLIDRPVKWPSSAEARDGVVEARGSVVHEILRELRLCWSQSIDALRRVSSSGWRWVVASERAG